MGYLERTRDLFVGEEGGGGGRGRREGEEGGGGGRGRKWHVGVWLGLGQSYNTDLLTPTCGPLSQVHSQHACAASQPAMMQCRGYQCRAWLHLSQADQSHPHL